LGREGGRFFAVFGEFVQNAPPPSAGGGNRALFAKTLRVPGKKRPRRWVGAFFEMPGDFFDKCFIGVFEIPMQINP
jgi:hypothetical protein